ncbi:MAG: CoB--CoM heterodisulfide reductase iron-sulfur subunit A family protein [Thermoanaerobacterales bacterium]|nr:CoB--CoM heterodisulfide reductase iron-sulfur subunit A family protein [Bacillota bacterium]MDI6905935.1 CoB--CoM heterodisulfide reductase iron-sulfur subunit A family protein [Thermoanaerobacterales bacterium]
MINKSILVVGGGIGGLTAALEAAEVGYEVILVEKNPYLGGRVAQLHHYFPKLCPPNCGLEINFKRIRSNPRIKFFTLAEVEAISGEKGNYDVTIKLTPRFVTPDCTACGQCVEVCPQDRPNPFNYGLDKTKAIYLPHNFSFPMKYVVDSTVCPGASCGKCVEVCPVKAIDLGMQAKTVNLKVGAVIWATGWDPYDATKIEYYGFGRYPDVITNVQLERLAAVNGPTQGKIVRPSDGKGIETIAFVQCAGSRDENHQPYCSQVCCLASLKQAMYVREQYPEAKIYIFYIDIRSLGKYEDVYTKVQEDAGVVFIKGKVGEITENPETKKLVLEVEDQLAGEVIHPEVDMVVLATGMAPAAKPAGGAAALDADGFVASEDGVVGAGCARKPMEVASTVRDATAAALKAIQAVAGGGN